MQSPYKSTDSKRTQKTPSELKRPEMASKEPVIADSTNQAHFIKSNRNKKSKLEGGSMYEMDENKDEKLDESLHHNSNL